MEYAKYANAGEVNAIDDEVRLLNENMALAHITINNVKETPDIKLLQAVCKINESFNSYKKIIDSDFVKLFKSALEQSSYHDIKVWTVDEDMKHYPDDQIKILNSIIQKFDLKPGIYSDKFQSSKIGNNIKYLRSVVFTFERDESSQYITVIIMIREQILPFVARNGRGKEIYRATLKMNNYVDGEKNE